MADKTFPLTRRLAEFSQTLRFEALPLAVRQESLRAFLNWFGCALGGRQAEVTQRVAEGFGQSAGAASLIGFPFKAAAAEAAFANCVASSALAFDDTHLATVTHPTGPVAAALLTEAEARSVSPQAFLCALVTGIEIQCRLSNLLLLPPAKPNLSLYITGVTGPIGAAAALAQLRGFSLEQTIWAMGHAATQASGFRATHGSMAGLIVPGYAARSAVFACDLAQAGVDCGSDLLESPRGFVGIFTEGADLGAAAAKLGDHFEMLANAYKPYPAGIVLHAAIDACLRVAEALPPESEIAQIEELEVTVPPLTQQLADRLHPTTPFDAPISLQHWAAYACARREAGVEGLSQSAIDDPALHSLRQRVVIKVDAALARDAASARLRLVSGAVFDQYIDHAIGSLERPMSDAALDAKFLSLASPVLGDRAEALRQALRGLDQAGDMGLVLKLGTQTAS